TQRSAERAGANTNRDQQARLQKTGAAPPPAPGSASAATPRATHVSPLPATPSTPRESHSPDTTRSLPKPQIVGPTSSHPLPRPVASPPTNSRPTLTTAQNNSPPPVLGAAVPVWPSPHNTTLATVGAPCSACAPAPRLRRD